MNMMKSSPTIKLISFNAIFSLIIFSCCLPPPPTAAFRNNETDWEALVAFKAGITSDPFGFLTSWNHSLPFCQWPGVQCNRRQPQRVTALVIQHQKLTGSLSPYIGNMSFLRNLSVANNSLSHEIPPQLGALRRLQLLYLNNNSFTGGIPPNLSACTELERLSVDRNSLSGKIPVELGSLSKLKKLWAGINKLTGGIPQSFGNLSSLVLLYASDNYLGGSIPSALGKLKNLQVLALYENNISGAIPFQIYNLSSLTVLEVGQNHIHGSLPPDMGSALPSLNFFGIAFNHFVGPVPASISNLSNLSVLQVIGNLLTGKVPTFHKLRQLSVLNLDGNHLGSRQENDLSFISSLSNASDLTYFGFSSNNFGGTLPESLGNLSAKLSRLAFQKNYISGSLSTGLESLVNLEWFSAFQNNFSGNIPTGLWKIQSLRYLFLDANKFSGKLSPSIGNLSHLLILSASNNDFHGPIPSSLGNCKSLLAIDLSSNKFNDTIPKEIFDLSSLSRGLFLSNNRLSGFLPKEVGYLKNIGVLNLSHNMFSGEIPSSLGSCTSMEVLDMSENNFQGNIPSSFSTLRGIHNIDLSRNNLSGEIPNLLGSLDLRFLNLSFNNFEGALPTQGIFKNFSAFSVTGNSRLCGNIPEMKLPLCLDKRAKKRRRSPTSRIVIPTALGLLRITSALGVLLCCWLRKKRKEPQSSTPEIPSLLKISFQTLVSATNGFASTNLIGIGSFGSVYKGILEDGKAIAVKVLNLHRHGALKSFMSECEALRNIRHRNLVRVLSACSGIDYQGNNFKAVVYELMVNGSLEEWLHLVQLEDVEPRKHLDIVKRFNIAMDVATAIDYLHHQCGNQIVHCDIKPSNILLDSEMVAHISDFGLARLIQEETNRFTADQPSSIIVKGTVGYAPPEYGMGSKASVYGDMYSYGILLLEMFTAKRPTDDTFHGSMNLHNFAKLAFSEGVVGVVDPMLLQFREDGETSSTNRSTSNQSIEKVEECLILILKIGVACSMELPRERMDITSVIAQLRVIYNILFTTNGVRGNERTRNIIY